MYWIDHGTYHKRYAEWGDRILIPEETTLVWAVCQGIDEMAFKPKGATAVHISPFGIVWAYD